MPKAKKKLSAAEQTAHGELIDKLTPALGLKLSTAERKALINGSKVSLEGRSLSEFGSILVRAEALRHAQGEAIIIRDLTHTPPDDTGDTSVVPFLKIACAKFKRVRCCLEVSWPPYIGINCEGTF
jgi:hypothetical protein